MRHVVFGDTGGHGSQLLASLVELGMDKASFLLPEDLTVIHMGDLIHRGPQSDELVQIVDRIMARNGERWVQLMGNHESQHLPGAPWFWRCACNEATLGTLHDWWGARKIRLAHALPPGSSVKLGEYADVADKGILFTHSGLGRPFWLDVLGSPASAELAAAAINFRPLQQIAMPGVMLGARAPWVGPLWALGSAEVFMTWLNRNMPFVQVHGHTAAYKWDEVWGDEEETWYPGTPDEYKLSTYLDAVNRVSYTPVGNSLLVGVDPGYEMYARQPAQPFLVL
jgi:hypothetical protein